MKINGQVAKILGYYESDNPGTKANLARMLMHGKLGGTGKMVILPVDQGNEHGPARSFAPNPPAYDPHYHFQLAIEAGLNAYAAPLGFLEAGAGTYAGQIPLILKANSANSLSRAKEGASQAVTASVKDALRLGCSAIGFTIYPGSDAAYDMFEEIAEIGREAKASGLAVVIWSYPRGGNLTREGETAIDICAYAAQLAAQLGAHIIKVKPPSAHLELPAAKAVYEKQNIDISTPATRIRHVVQSAFNGRRIVIFSGGEAKTLDDVFDEVRAIRDGGANGSIIGRNTFQRPKADALDMLNRIIKIYQGKRLILLTDDPRATTRLYLITPPAFDPVAFAPQLEAALSGGDVACVQLRLKDVDDDAIRRAAGMLRPIVQRGGVAFVMNDRPDLAAELDCDGVHVGEEDMPYLEARRVCGPDRIVGVTCGASRHRALVASEAGADYVAFGAFFPSMTKAGAKYRATPEVLRDWSETTVVPCCAIGGITQENCGPLVEAGADFLAVIGAIWQHPQGPRQAVADFNAVFARYGRAHG